MAFCKKYDILSLTQKQELLKLWNVSYPIKLAYNSMTKFDAYLNSLSALKHILVKDKSGKIIAWYFDFEREGDKWFGIIVDKKNRKKGIAKNIINNRQNQDLSLNGWVIDHENEELSDGSIYHSPLKFYTNLGFEILSNNRLETEAISAVQIQWKN